MADAGKSSTGLDANVAAGLAVLLTWIGGLVFFLVEKDSKFVRFHAMQSILIGIGFNLIPLLEFSLGIAARLSGPLGWTLRGIGGLVWLFLAVCWLVALINAFQGKLWQAPVLGQIARKQAGL